MLTKGQWIAAGGAVATAVALVAGGRGLGRDSGPAPVQPVSATARNSTQSSTSGTPTNWVTSNQTLTVGGIARRYLVVRPATVSKAALPVVVVLHGRNATPEIEEQRTGFTGIAGPAILVYPAGYQESWNAGACCAGAHDAGVDDVAFINDVVHRVLASQKDAAADRVFLVGFSNGGKMAFRVVCAEPQLFRAVAVVGAVPVSDCAPPPAVPFAEVAIDQDPLLTLTPAQPVKAVNGFPQASIEGEVAALRTANGCSADGRSQVRGTLTTTRFTTCRSGHPVEFDLYHGTAHVWPAGDATTPAAQGVIWDFFRSITEDHR
jgi:polyhydroxybutyrate depolymerase